MNLDCKFIEENLLEYVYDEIVDVNILEGIKRHLRGCLKCRERYEAYIKIKESIKKIEIDFPEEIWNLQRQEIKKKIAEKRNIMEIIKEKIAILFNVKKIIFAFLVLLFVLIGFQFIKTNQEKEKYKSIIENMEILENISIIEQLDFYTKLKEGDFDL